MVTIQGSSGKIMKIVVDSNIVFSAILNSSRNIGQLIINGSNHFHFYSVSLLKDEIINHKEKILKISGYSERQFDIAFLNITSRIQFINDILIPDIEVEKALLVVEDIDENDTLFVALCNYLDAKLWTGDKKLISGLHSKGYKRTISTEELMELFILRQIKPR